MDVRKAKIRNLQRETLSDEHFKLQKVSYEFKTGNDDWDEQEIETYDIGNAVTGLLYNPEKGTVVLLNQFRLVTYLNHNPDGMLLETCAGKIEGEAPDEAMLREIHEETGYQVKKLTKLFKAYLSPGSVIELIHFYLAEYNGTKMGEGGGKKDEHEHIEIIELPFEEAYAMIESNEIKDAKTIMLLQWVKINQQV